MLLPAFLLTVIFFHSHEAVVESLDEVVEEARDEMHPITVLQALILKSSMPIHDFLISNDQSEKEHYQTLKQKVEEKFHSVFDAPFGLSEEKKLIRSAYQEWQESIKAGDTVLSFSQQEREGELVAMMEEFDSHIDETVRLLEQNHMIVMNEMNELLIAVQVLKRRSILFILAVFIVGVSAAIVASLKLPRSILAPLQTLTKAAEHLGEGDLACRVPFDTHDELGKLSRTFNIMAARLENSQAALEELATLDPLTDINNRREFYRRLHEEAERSHRYDRVFSLFIMDLDNFKRINDTYGHPAGDKVLKTIAEVVKNAVRPVDILARYGGDEFALILPETPLQKALILAERIRHSVEVHTIPLTAGKEVSLTISIGAADFPKDGETADKLISTADSYLYESKRSGRNRVYYVSS
jgi:diguanylate cyclase (GGDEF)-like protein